MALNIGINGFGRLGRVFFRTCFEYEQLEVTAINDPIIDTDYICYLIKFDSTHGKFKGSVEQIDNGILVNGKTVQIFHQKKPQLIPWYLAKVDYVIEASGIFTTMEKASLHLTRGRQGAAGVRRVVVSAPSNNVPVIILGVNHDKLTEDMRIISCASSTLYCLAPLVKVLDDHFGVVEGMMTSVHAMTPALKPLDGFCSRSKHWRDHRGALQNIIPATSGACRALEQLIPHLAGRLAGVAYRVPVVDVSILDLTVKLENNTNLSEIQKRIDEASHSYMKHVIRTSQEETVSSDFLGDKHSCILDMKSSIALNEHFYKLVCWYENEYSYACRLAEVIIFAENPSCRPLPLKINTCIDKSQQEAQKADSGCKTDAKTFIIPNIKSQDNKRRNISPFRLKSLNIKDVSQNVSRSNIIKIKEKHNGKFVVQPKDDGFNGDHQKGDQLVRKSDNANNNIGMNRYESAFECKDNLIITGQSLTTDYFFRPQEIKTRRGKVTSDSFIERINQASVNHRSNKDVSKDFSKKSENNISLENQLKCNNILHTQSVDFECLDFCESNPKKLSKNNRTMNASLASIGSVTALENRTLSFNDETKHSPPLINESFISEMLTVSYSEHSTAMEEDEFVYYIGEPMRKMTPKNTFSSPYFDNLEFNQEKFNHSTGNNCFQSRPFQTNVYYVNTNKEMDIASTEHTDESITVHELQNSMVNLAKSKNKSKLLKDKIKPTLKLGEKVDSSSETDSNNSFQINEKKSIEIKLSDVTDSLEELQKLDKICRIMEISDDLSDRLFDKLEETQNNKTTEGWSLKELCEKIQLDDFFKSLFFARNN